jgi:hypothetical protein
VGGHLIRVVCAALAALVLGLSLSCGSSSQTVTSPGGSRCALQVQTESTTFAAEGGSGVLRVSTARECSWTAQSQAAWLGLPSPATGQGDGSLPFTVSPNADPSARSGSIGVNDAQLQISQTGSPCDLRVSSTYEAVDATGGDRTITVTASSDQCAWTASSSVPWIDIASGREGRGTGAVRLRISAVGELPRTGVVTVAGQTVHVEQGSGCTYGVDATTFSIGAGGGPGQVAVSAPPGCAWAAESQAPWLTITTGGSGSGTGVVGFQVSPSDGSPRTGTFIAAGRVVTVTQSAACTMTVDGATRAIPADGGTGTIAVLTGSGCGWSAASTAPWIVITAGQSGSGPGEVRFSVAPAGGTARTGAIRIGTVDVTISQAATQPVPCTFAAAPVSVTSPSEGGSGSIQVTTTPGCEWTARSGAPWVLVADAGGGAGSGAIGYLVTANTGPARQATMTVAGHTVTVSQASGCTFALSAVPDLPAAGGSGAVGVKTGAGCPWSAVSGAGWLAVSPATGAGPGQVQLTAAPNSGPPRTGTVTIAGLTATVQQASPCVWTFSPPSADMDASGGFGTVLVFVSGACTWTAESLVPWITVVLATGPSEPGSGMVQMQVAPNTGPARSGVVVIGGVPYTVTQGALIP